MLVIAAAGALVYSNTFGAPFVFDDAPRIVNNAAIRTLWPPTATMSTSNRPFVDYTFAINYALDGTDVWGYHVVNLAIHIAASLCLFGIVRRTLRRCGERLEPHADALALLIAVVWLVHPLDTQAVTYIVQRLESLMGLAYFATLYGLIRAHDSPNPRRWYVASVAACALGMGCKEVMVSAPLLALWYDRAFLASSWREIVARRKYYYLALTATWGVLVGAMLNCPGDYTNGSLVSVEGLTPWNYLISQAGVIVYYLQLCFWPQGQCFAYGWVPTHSLREVLPQAIIVVALLAATVWAIFRHPKWGFLGGWFFLILAPTSSVVPIADLAFEHRMYLPLAAVVTFATLIVALVGPRLTAHRQAVSPWVWRALAIGVIIALGQATYRRNEVYASPIALWSDVVAKAPRNAQGWSNLGGALEQAGRSDEAQACYQRALEIDPKHFEARANLAGMLVDHGRFDEAVEHYQVALKRSPTDSDTAVALAGALVPLGRFDEAESLCRQVLEREPASAKAHVNLAFALVPRGRSDQAAQHFRAAIDSDPQCAEAHAGLAQIVAESDLPRAVAHMAEAVRLRPTAPNMNLGMGNLIARSNPRAAIKYFETALQAQPEFPEAWFNLSNAWIACGRPEKAIECLENAVKLAPNWVEAQNNLQLLRQRTKR